MLGARIPSSTDMRPKFPNVTLGMHLLRATARLITRRVKTLPLDWSRGASWCAAGSYRTSWLVGESARVCSASRRLTMSRTLVRPRLRGRRSRSPRRPQSMKSPASSLHTRVSCVDTARRPERAQHVQMNNVCVMRTRRYETSANLRSILVSRRAYLACLLSRNRVALLIPMRNRP